MHAWEQHVRPLYVQACLGNRPPHTSHRSVFAPANVQMQQTAAMKSRLESIDFMDSEGVVGWGLEIIYASSSRGFSPDS